LQERPDKAEGRVQRLFDEIAEEEGRLAVQVTLALLFCYTGETAMIQSMKDGVDRTARLRVLSVLTGETEERKKSMEQGKRGQSAFKARLYELRDIRSRCPIIEEKILSGEEAETASPKEEEPKEELGDPKPKRKMTGVEKFYLQRKRSEERQRPRDA